MISLFQPTAEQKQVIDKITSLSKKEFASRAAHYDETSTFPIENYQDLHKAGLLGLTIPKVYGGLGLDPITYSVCLLEIAKGCPATALTFNMHSTVLTFVDALGTADQKRRYFGEVLDKGKLIASITSEPESSFRDRFVMRTLFQPVGDGYRVKGVKHFCSLGDSADFYFVSGVLEGQSSAQEGILSAMIPADNPGVDVEKTWNATGMRGTSSHTIHYDSLIDQSEVIGNPGQLLTLDLSGWTLGYAATYLGIAEAALEFIVEHVKTRSLSPSPEPMSHHPLTQRAIGEMGTSVRAAKLMLYEAAYVKMQGDKDATTLAVNQAKYLAAEVGIKVTEQALRLAGGRGILKELPLERWHRDALAGPVMPPSNDRCLETIGKALCGLRAPMLEIQ